MSWTDADRDLQALVGIQGVEATPLAREYRSAWLDGRVLDDREAAYAWIRAHGTRAHKELLVSFDMTAAPPHRNEIAAWVAENADAARLVRPRNRDPWVRVEVRDASGELTDTLDLDAEAGTAIGELHKIATVLKGRYRWEYLDAVMFILTGELPIQGLIETSSLQETRIRSATDSTIASLPMSREIVIRCRPQATQKQVADAYEAQRRSSLEIWEKLDPSASLTPPLLTPPLISAPGERNRRTNSPYTPDRAVLVARVLSGEFESAAHARDVYVREHPDEELTYPSTHDGISRFRRDMRAAWRRITGRDFTFKDAFHDRAGV